MSESDGVEEALQGALRIMMTAAARAGEEVSRARQRDRAAATDASEARAAELGARLEAERACARTAYRGPNDAAWWASADVEDITAAYYTATAWRDVDPEAATAARLIEREVLGRHGIAVEDLAVSTVNRDRDPETRHDQARHESDRADAQQLEAAALLSAADRADNSTHISAENVVSMPGSSIDAPPAWDSPERREATRQDLTAKVDDPRAVAAKSLADLAQGRPPTAVATAKSRGTATQATSVVGTGLDSARASERDEHTLGR